MSEIFIADMGEVENMDRAKEVADLLEHAYPGYFWMVASANGCLSVKCGALVDFGPYGFILERDHSYQSLRATALLAGGELLERCGLPTNGKAWDGTAPTHMEGADPNRARNPLLKRLAIYEYRARTHQDEDKSFYIAQARAIKTRIENTFH